MGIVLIVSLIVILIGLIGLLISGVALIVALLESIAIPLGVGILVYILIKKIKER